jgi:spore coat protein U-like protein
MIALLFVVAAGVKPAAAASCSLSGSSIVFGNYSGGTIDVTGTLMVFCTSGTAFHIGLNAGNTSGATITNRLMFGGNGGQNTLGYQLFNDAARTINWGNSSGTNWVSGTGTGNNQQFTIYARMPANEVSPQGNYTDTITASITGSFTTGIGSFSVTSTVVPGCTVGATNLAFGAYTNALINSTSTITVTCPSGTTYQVGLNAGTASGATVTNRNMTGPGGALLGYKLFRNAAHTLNWGSTVGSDTLAGSGNGSAQLLSVYGQLPGGQSARPGNYSDTITVTITY